MPFGISSAPEVFQPRMCEVAEGLKVVEEVADDLVVVGFGDTEDEAARDHDQNLEATLQRCIERNLRLNDRKLRLPLKEVPSTQAKFELSWICHLQRMLQQYNAF